MRLVTKRSLSVPLLISLLPFAVGYLQTQARVRDRTMLLALETAHAQLAATHAELETAHLQLTTSAGRIEELTRLTERQRLARDLHDTLAQGLSGLILQLEVTHSRLAQGRHVQAQSLVHEALLDARQMLGEARGTIDHLRAESSQSTDFLESAEQAIRRFTAMTGVICTTELACLANCPVLFHEHILRIMSEGLTNIARHAQARHAWIVVREEGAGITLEVRDDGRGFDPEVEALQGGHYGLVGMRERARLLGGDMELTSTPGAGTLLHFRLRYAGKETKDESSHSCGHRR
jgi:two-component system, NarL family, sensor histidine kinase YdfH